MKHFFLILALSVGLSVSAQICQIERATPEACGIPSETITRYFDSLMVIPRTSIHNVMILRHDKVVAEMYPQPFLAYALQLFQDVCERCYRYSGRRG